MKYGNLRELQYNLTSILKTSFNDKQNNLNIIGLISINSTMSSLNAS